jgi:ketosteroid isomerase-like protein
MKSAITVVAVMCASFANAASGLEPTDEIRAVIDKYAKSINLAATKLAAEIWSNGAGVSMIHPGGHEHGWNEIKSNFYEKTMGAKFSERSLKPYYVTVHVLYDTAWAEFYWDFEGKAKSDGRTLNTKGRETQIYKWTTLTGWRIVHVHYSETMGENMGF